MIPKLKYNCPEKWDTMKIGLLSRHCENCDREVYDFTKMTKEEILVYFIKNQDRKVCGRILPSQLDFSYEERLIIIDGLLQKNKKSNLGFYLLAMGTMTLLSCSNDYKDSKTLSKLDSIIQINSSTDSIATIQTYHKTDIILPDSFPALLGEMIPYYDKDTISDPNVPRTFAEIMPEFIGGIDSLFTYLQSKINYPDWEKKNKIEGTIYVSFIVDKDGKISTPEIIRTVKESKNLNDEVLQVVSSMPKWKPGQNKGKNVAVKMILPIKFKL